jgi:uncharacterized protein
MPLTDDVSAAIADAMRKRDALRLSALRMLKAAFMNREIERGHALDDNEARQVVASRYICRRPQIRHWSNARLPTRLRRPARRHPRTRAA